MSRTKFPYLFNNKKILYTLNDCDPLISLKLYAQILLNDFTRFSPISTLYAVGTVSILQIKAISIQHSLRRNVE